MKIVKTTDNRHIGVNIDRPTETNCLILINDFEFIVEKITVLENLNILLSNPNYQIEIEE